MGEEAKLGARLDLDGGGFHKTLKESRMEVKSFQKDLHFIQQGMGLAFGVRILEEFAGAFKSLKAYEKENGLELLAPDAERHLDSVIDSFDEIKMKIIAVGAAMADDFTKGIQAAAAGLASWFDPQVMADAITPKDMTMSQGKELIDSTKKADDAAEKLAKYERERGDSEDMSLVRKREELRLLDQQADKQAAIVRNNKQAGLSDAEKVDDLVKYNQLLTDQANKKMEVDKLTDKLSERDKKLAEEPIKDREKVEKKKAAKEEADHEAGYKRFLDDQHHDDEIARATEIAKRVKAAERGYELQDATTHLGGFQHQSGGAYAGLVGNQQNKDLSIAERSAKASEKLVQLAEHWARRDAVDKIKHGDGL